MSPRLLSEHNCSVRVRRLRVSARHSNHNGGVRTTPGHAQGTAALAMHRRVGRPFPLALFSRRTAVRSSPRSRLVENHPPLRSPATRPQRPRCPMAWATPPLFRAHTAAAAAAAAAEQQRQPSCALFRDRDSSTRPKRSTGPRHCARAGEGSTEGLVQLGERRRRRARSAGTGGGDSAGERRAEARRRGACAGGRRARLQGGRGGRRGG